MNNRANRLLLGRTRTVHDAGGLTAPCDRPFNSPPSHG